MTVLAGLGAVLESKSGEVSSAIILSRVLLFHVRLVWLQTIKVKATFLALRTSNTLTRLLFSRRLLYNEHIRKYLLAQGSVSCDVASSE